MISTEEIKKLADLARIRISEAETKKLQDDLGKILDYVSELKKAPTADKIFQATGENMNQWRDDDEPEPAEESSGFIRVKKIL